MVNGEPHLSSPGTPFSDLRVTMISKALVVGAYQSKAEELARHPDLKLTVVVPPSWRELGRETTLERTYVEGYKLVVTPIRFNGHFHYHYYPRLGEVLDQSRPRIIHIDEEPYNLATLHALWLGRRRHAKIIIFTWQNLFRRLPPPFSWLEKYVLNRTDHAICGNAAAVEVLRKKGFDGPATIVPQFGFDPGLFQPAPDPRPHRPFTIGYAGRLIERKGLRDLLTACQSLTGDWQLHLVGDGPFKQELLRQAGAAGVAERLVFTPPVASTAMASVYHNLDVFVLPSRSTASWKEQFGRVLVEAMACRVPVIGSDSGEIPNVIGPAGLVFPEGDVVALGAHLAQLQANPDLRARLAELGRARFLAEYTQECVASRTADVYRQVMT